MNLLVIDAQGGGLGKQIITKIKNDYPEIHILAVGTNTIATSAMLKAGADEAATGENSVVVASRQADIIIGPIGIVVADSMLGEITPVMAKAVAQSSAKRILIPFNSCQNYIAGVGDLNTSKLVDDAISYLKKILDN
ncbi:MAG: DUF3842 family protein [Lachnospiraceae bacterium]|nr:DUF3842 family protein [Lachnospiraceae bacterium]